MAQYDRSRLSEKCLCDIKQKNNLVLEIVNYFIKFSRRGGNFVQRLAYHVGGCNNSTRNDFNDLKGCDERKEKCVI